MSAKDTSDISSNDNPKFDEIEDLINKTEDNGAVELDAKEYDLPSNKTLHLNKSITINGIINQTVIEGNNNYLDLDTLEKEKNIQDGDLILILDDGLKNNGKHIIFNNITFKNIHIRTWHKMEFNNCHFINSTFTSEELDNKFSNCTFNNSKVEFNVIATFLTTTPSVYNELVNCRFYNSEVKTKLVYAQGYIYRVGSDFFEVYDSINLTNCYFYNSKLAVNNVNLTIKNTAFNHTNITCHSNSINIEGSDFSNANIDFTICKTNISDTAFNNTLINLHASYFSIGTLTNLKNTSLNNTKITVTPGFRSRQNQISIINSSVDNSYIDTTDTHVIIENSKLDMTNMLLAFSSLNIANSTIYTNGTIENAIATKLEDTREQRVDGKLVNTTVHYQIKTDYETSNTYYVNETGKYLLKSEDISKNTLYNFTYIKQDVYILNNVLVFRLTDQNGNPVSGEKIYIDIEDRYFEETPTIVTDENGTAKYKLAEVGNLNITAYYTSAGFDFDDITHSINLYVSVKPDVDDLKVEKITKTSTYANIKSYLKLSVISKKVKDLSNVKIAIKITSKNANKKYNVYTNSKGADTFDIPSKLDAGNYKLEITVVNTNITKTLNFKVNKAKTKVTTNFKKSKCFKINVKNSHNKKAVSNVKVKIKVYNSKNIKTYTVKTNKKGIAKINTKNLKSGKYKVSISSKDINYKISKKSTITIK